VADQVLIDGEELILSVEDSPELEELGARRRHDGRWILPAASWIVRWIAELLVGEEAATVALPAPRDVEWDHPNRQDLFAHQVDPITRLVSRPHGQLAVMSPGLGKTIVAILAADVLKANVLVVAPSSLRFNWFREIDTWSDGRSTSWTVVSYDELWRKPNQFKGLRFDVLILDESVLVKSRNAKRHKAAFKLRSQARLVWELTGNPTTRYADDLWGQLHIIWPKAFSSYWRFARRYCYTRPTAWGESVTGTRATRNALRDSSDLAFTVQQEDVLELPEYLFEVLDVELAPRQARAYDQMLTDFRSELAGGEMSAGNKAARLIRLQQIASWADDSSKHNAVLELLESGYLETPAIIWTHWLDGAEELAERIAALGPSTAWVHGTQTVKRKDELLEEYKAGNVDVLVLSLGVGKFGHTFTNTQSMVYVDKTWNADDYFQSLHRVRRIGLKHSPLVLTIRAPGTVDDLVERNLTRKMKDASRMTNAELSTLLAGLGRNA
jgi:SNF2 family DNA or RNA helicase